MLQNRLWFDKIFLFLLFSFLLSACDCMLCEQLSKKQTDGQVVGNYRYFLTNNDQ